MSIDSGLIGRTAAELMESLESDGIRGEIDTVVIAVAVDDPEDDEGLVRIKCSDDRCFVQAGLLRAAQLITEMGWRAEDDNE